MTVTLWNRDSDPLDDALDKLNTVIYEARQSRAPTRWGVGSRRRFLVLAAAACAAIVAAPLAMANMLTITDPPPRSEHGVQVQPLPTNTPQTRAVVAPPATARRGWLDPTPPPPRSTTPVAASVPLITPAPSPSVDSPPPAA